LYATWSSMKCNINNNNNNAFIAIRAFLKNVIILYRVYRYIFYIQGSPYHSGTTDRGTCDFKSDYSCMNIKNFKRNYSLNTFDEIKK